MNALAFDVIGDLAFGQTFGMLDRDAADIVAITTESGEIIHAPAVRILNERGEFSSTQGALPPWVRPYTRYFDPWFARGLSSVKNLAGVSFALLPFLLNFPNKLDRSLETASTLDSKQDQETARIFFLICSLPSTEKERRCRSPN